MVGIAGSENQQDCVARVELREQGGIEIKITGKNVKLFGRLMEAAAADAAGELGVRAAYIEINDNGSLDFVIKARTKTAIRRAWRECGEEA